MRIDRSIETVGAHRGGQATANPTAFPLLTVLVAGGVAGAVFAICESVAAMVIGGPQALTQPFRMTAAIAIGNDALDYGYPQSIAVSSGLFIHLVLSMVYAALFAAVVSSRLSRGAFLLLGGAYGMVLWLVNFYVFAPAAGWLWFPHDTNPPLQFIAHVLGFGTVLGWYLHRGRTVISD